MVVAGALCTHWLLRRLKDLVVSLIKGTTIYAIVLIIGTNQKVPLILGNPVICAESLTGSESMKSSGAVERFWFRGDWPNQDVIPKKPLERQPVFLDKMGWMAFYVLVEEDAGKETND